MAFVAVHGGCGQWGGDEAAIRAACASGCTEGIRALAGGGSAFDGAVAAVGALEAAHCTNSGVGSNLTRSGAVECDAAIVATHAGEALCGAVGAVRGLRHPVHAAAAVAIAAAGEEREGLVLPVCMVGAGAEAYAAEAGVPRCPPEALVLPQRARQREAMLEGLGGGCLRRSKRRRGGGGGGTNDTVGAVVVDERGDVAAAVSSGGIWLKRDGRLGHAAVPGAGCFAQGAVAVATTGVGEEIIRTQLVRARARATGEGG